jgi:hypothetical protein
VELTLGLVCDDARITEQGKLDVRGVFNDLFAPGFPAKQDRMVLVMGLEWDRGDDGRYTFRVDLEDPSGRPVLTLEGHTDVDRRTPDRPPARTRLVMPLEEVVFTRPGRYRFVLRMKGSQLPGPALHVIEADAAPEETSVPAVESAGPEPGEKKSP